MNTHDIVNIFVPVDRRTLEPEEESVALEAFAACLLGMSLGCAGLEHIADLIDTTKILHEINDAVRPQITPAAMTLAIAAYRRNPIPFPKGTTPGVWIPVLVPKRRMDAAMAKLYPALAMNWRTPPMPQVSQARIERKEEAKDVPWRKVYYPQLRPVRRCA